MSGTIPKNLRPLAKRLLDSGWELAITGRTHLCFSHPEYGKVFTGMTGSGNTHRYVEAEVRRRMRRFGGDVGVLDRSR